jgi:hypothetical protein
MLLAVVHFIGGDAGPLVTQFLEPLPPGSYLVISRATADRHPDAIPEAAAVQEIYHQRPAAQPRRNPGAAERARHRPGLVRGPLWRPDPGPASRMTPQRPTCTPWSPASRYRPIAPSGRTFPYHGTSP